MADLEKFPADSTKMQALPETHSDAAGYPTPLRQDIVHAILQESTEDLEGTPRAGSWSKRAASEPRLHGLGPSMGIRKRLEQARSAAAQASNGAQQGGDLMEARTSLQESLRILERKLKAEQQSAVSSTAKARALEHSSECSTPKNSKALPHRVKAKHIDVDCDLMLLRRELQETLQLKDTALREVKVLQREAGQLKSCLKAKDVGHHEEADALKQALEAERRVTAEQRQEKESLSQQMAVVTEELAAEKEALRAAKSAREEQERRAAEAHRQYEDLARVEQDLRERCSASAEKEQQLEAQKREATHLLEAQQATHEAGKLELQQARQELSVWADAAKLDLQVIRQELVQAQGAQEQAATDRLAAEKRLQEEQEKAAADRLAAEKRLQEEQATHQEREAKLAAAVQAAEELAVARQVECEKWQDRLAESLQETQQLTNMHEEQLRAAVAERDAALEACENLRQQLLEQTQVMQTSTVTAQEALLQLRQKAADLTLQLSTEQNSTAQEQRNRLSAELSVLTATSEAEQWMEKCQQEQALREEIEQRLASAEQKLAEQDGLHARIRSRESLQRQALRRIEAQLHKPVWEQTSCNGEVADDIEKTGDEAGKVDTAEEVEELAWLHDLQHMVKALSQRAHRLDDVIIEGSRLKDQLAELQSARCADAQQLQALKTILEAERALAHRAEQESGKPKDRSRTDPGGAVDAAITEALHNSTAELDAARVEIIRLQGLLRQAGAATKVQEKPPRLERFTSACMSQFELELLQKLVAKQAEELYEARQELSRLRQQAKEDVQSKPPQVSERRQVEVKDDLADEPYCSTSVVQATDAKESPLLVVELSSLSIPATSHRHSLEKSGTVPSATSEVDAQAAEASTRVPRPVASLPFARVPPGPLDRIDKACLPKATPTNPPAELLEVAQPVSRFAPVLSTAHADAGVESAEQAHPVDEATELDSTAPTQVMVDEAMQQIQHAVLACFPDVASPAGSTYSVRRSSDEDTSVRTSLMEAPQLFARTVARAGQNGMASPRPHSDSLEVHSVRSRVGGDPCDIQAVIESMSSLQNKLLGQQSQANKLAR